MGPSLFKFFGTPYTEQEVPHLAQAKNHTKARLDYFLLNDNALESVVKVGIGRENALSDHCPIYIHLRLTKVKRGRGFWRLNNEFLREPEYVFGLNNRIEAVIEQYS